MPIFLSAFCELTYKKTKRGAKASLKTTVNVLHYVQLLNN